MARSRTGCANCRKRKRKCDETWPECRACRDRGLLCGGSMTPLRWGNGIASRGRFAGAANPGQPVQALRSSSSPVSTPVSDESARASPHIDDETATTSCPSTARSDNESQHKLFLEFMRAGMYRFYSTAARSQLVQLFQQLTGESEAIMSICAAVHVYLTEGDSLAFMEHTDRALRVFRAELDKSSGEAIGGTMCAGLLVCTLSQIQGRPWMTYLEHITELYHLQGDFGSLQADPEYNLGIQHSLEVMAIMDLRFMVIGRPGPTLGVWKRFRASQDSWREGRLKGIEIISGIPRSLLDVFADIFEEETRGDCGAEARLWMWPGELGSFRECQIWEAWRLAAILNLRRWQTLPQAPSSSGRCASSSVSATREVILSRLLSCMEAVMQRGPDGDSLAVSTLLYPVVAAGLEVSLLRAHPEWKALLDSISDRLIWEAPKKPSIKALFEILGDAWAAGGDGFDIDEAARARGVEIALF